MRGWEEVPDSIEDYEGFVYGILERDTGRRYIGSKLFWKVEKKPPLKGKKNRRWKRKESDWRTYIGSNTELQRKIKKNPDNYIRYIIRPCRSRTEMRCAEAAVQLDFYFMGKWNDLYNEMINLRVRIPKG